MPKVHQILTFQTRLFLALFIATVGLLFVGASVSPGPVLHAAAGGLIQGGVGGALLTRRWGRAYALLWLAAGVMASPWIPLFIVPPVLVVCSGGGPRLSSRVWVAAFCVWLAMTLILMLELEWAVIVSVSAGFALFFRRNVLGSGVLVSIASAWLACLMLHRYVVLGKLPISGRGPSVTWRRVVESGWFGGPEWGDPDRMGPAIVAIAEWGGWLALIGYALLLFALATCLLVMASRDGKALVRNLATATIALLFTHSVLHLQLIGGRLVFAEPSLPFVGTSSEILAEMTCLGLVLALMRQGVGGLGRSGLSRAAGRQPPTNSPLTGPTA